MKKRKRAEIFIQLDLFKEAIQGLDTHDVDTLAFKQAVTKFGKAYSRLVQLGLAGERAERERKCSQ